MLLILFIILTITAYGGKELAVTIDDLPFLYGRYLPDSVESDKFRCILKTLKKHKVQVIGFVVGSRINARNRGLLDEFVADGQIIGNHTFTHPDLNSTSVSWYEDDVIKGENAIEKWIGQPKYFRYPYLHQGPTESKHSAVAQFLTANAYINVPVTIDNNDWLYNREYVEALKKQDRVAADSIGRAYIAHMQAMTQHFDSLATAKPNREIKQILLIHMTELNSVYLDLLLAWYEDQGWQFITPMEALTDSIYQMQDSYVGPIGTSWLLRFEEEPEVTSEKK